MFYASLLIHNNPKSCLWFKKVIYLFVRKHFCSPKPAEHYCVQLPAEPLISTKLLNYRATTYNLQTKFKDVCVVWVLMLKYVCVREKQHCICENTHSERQNTGATYCFQTLCRSHHLSPILSDPHTMSQSQPGVNKTHTKDKRKEDNMTTSDLKQNTLD